VDITSREAALNQLGTAIRLYFEDRDPVSVHTLISAAGELLDRMVGSSSPRNDLLARAEAVGRRREVSDKLNAPRNFFKHGSNDIEPIFRNFSDDINLYSIVWACQTLSIIGLSLPETKIFKSWLSVVEPDLFLAPPPETIGPLFGDIRNQSRVEQKKIGRDVLHLELTGKLPD